MTVPSLLRWQPQQDRAVDRRHLPRRRLDIECEVVQFGSDEVEDRRNLLRSRQVYGLGRSLRMAKAGAIHQHLMRFPPREVREPGWRD